MAEKRPSGGHYAEFDALGGGGGHRHRDGGFLVVASLGGSGRSVVRPSGLQPD